MPFTISSPFQCLMWWQRMSQFNIPISKEFIKNMITLSRVKSKLHIIFSILLNWLKKWTWNIFRCRWPCKFSKITFIRITSKLFKYYSMACILGQCVLWCSVDSLLQLSMTVARWKFWFTLKKSNPSSLSFKWEHKPLRTKSFSTIKFLKHWFLVSVNLLI
jgi:hypothetical protein